MTYAEKLKDPRWQKKRLEVMELSEWKCCICKNDEQTLHVHHDKYTGEPWEADNVDLYVLCESCHKLSHDLKIKPSMILYYKQRGDEHPEPEKHLIFWNSFSYSSDFKFFYSRIHQVRLGRSEVYFLAYLQAEGKIHE